MTKLPLQSIRYIVICLVGLIGFTLLTILPSHRAIRTTERQIAELKQAIEEQQALQPLFQQLLEQAKRRTPSDMPFPKKAKLGRGETGGISSFFQELARRNDFRVESIVPDVVSLTDGSGYLKLNTVMTGRFLDFRKLLLQLGELPYLEHIETIQIRTIGELKEFRLKLWILQE